MQERNDFSTISKVSRIEVSVLQSKRTYMYISLQHNDINTLLSTFSITFQLLILHTAVEFSIYPTSKRNIILLR